MPAPDPVVTGRLLPSDITAGNIAQLDAFSRRLGIGLNLQRGTGLFTASRAARGAAGLRLLRAPGWSFMWPLIIDTDGIIDGVAQQFVERIELGYEWPVRTGFSKNNFYSRGSGIYNFADYAYYVEHARNSPHRQVLHRLYRSWEPDTPQAFASAFVGV